MTILITGSGTSWLDVSATTLQMESDRWLRQALVKGCRASPATIRQVHEPCWQNVHIPRTGAITPDRLISTSRCARRYTTSDRPFGLNSAQVSGRASSFVCRCPLSEAALSQAPTPASAQRGVIHATTSPCYSPAAARLWPPSRGPSRKDPGGAPKRRQLV